MTNQHPYFKYGLAVVMAENDFTKSEDILNKLSVLSSELQKGLNHFRMKPVGTFKGMDKVKFQSINEKKGNPDNGIFLSPNIISSDKAAGNLYKACDTVRKTVEKTPDKKIDATMSIIPITGEYLRFSEKGTGRGKPKITLTEAALALVTSTTIWKPCLSYRKISKGKVERSNTTIIPDLKIKEMLDFVFLFKRLVLNGEKYNLNEGNVYREYKSNGEVKTEKPARPHIYNGNFPFAPRSSALGKVALLGAIGAWSKEAGFNEEGIKVLESLKNTQMYMVSYGGAETFQYNNYVIDLAINNQLRKIIDSIYYSQLYKVGSRNQSNKLDYQNFDLFTGRFLQLFNLPSLKDFLSFRAEYQQPVGILLKTYFEKMEKIPMEVVASAKALGHWLNLAAFIAAKEDVKKHQKDLIEGSKEYWTQVSKMKSKFLVEIESSAFSARSGNALCMQVIRRAGLLSNMDAPTEASLFIEKTCNEGSLKLEQAKNLLIAFSRIKHIKAKLISPIQSDSQGPETTDDTPSYADA